MSRRFSVLFVLLVLTSLVLSACGGGAAAPTAAPVATTAPVATEAPAATTAPTEAPMATEAPAATEAPTEEPTVAPTEVMTTTADATPTMEPTEVPAATGDAGTLVIWADNTRAPAIRAIAADFEKENGVKLVVSEIGFGDIRDNVKRAAPAGDPFVLG